ncbi:FlgO family outer membrane protein [Malaciobacter sp. WC5094]
MKSSFSKNLRSILLLGFLTLFLTSCSYYKIPIDGANDFHSLVSKLVDESAVKIKKNVAYEEVVLVSDFVNIQDLENKSQLGFLLSNILKDKLVSLDIVVREVTFGKEFQLGQKGFNMLIRDKRKIISDEVTKARYAVVGTYSISTRSLNIFIKLIDIQTGNILASSHERTSIDEEIIDLEGEEERKIVLKPRVVL